MGALELPLTLLAWWVLICMISVFVYFGINGAKKWLIHQIMKIGREERDE